MQISEPRLLQQTDAKEGSRKTVDGSTNDGQSTKWQAVSLGEIFRFTKKPKDLRYAEFEQIPFIPMELLPVGRTSFDQFLLKGPDEISSGTYFEPGDILLAKITPSFENGKQGIIEKLPTPFGVATTEVIPIKEVEGVSNKLE
jgi:type I restriction enzyme S subunit